MAGNSMDMQINFDFQAKNLDQIVSQINQIQQAFQQKGTSVGFNDKDIKAYSNSLEILKQNTVKTFDVMNSKASNNKVGQALKQAGVDANNLQNAMRKLGVNGVSSLDGVSKSAAQTKKELGKISEGLKEISNTFTSALKWNLAYGAINSMSSSLKDAVHFAKELDSTLTDIRIVAGLTKDEAIAFGEEATKLAQRLGSTTSEYTKASLIYFQQGLDTSQVKEMTDATVMAANITGESARDMSDYLTAVVNGYGMVADEAMSVVDKLAAVGAATASDFGELSIGMSKVASMAKTAGVPIEKLAAQLSTIISTTKEAPESVGTSLKTIYSRMLQFKTGTGKDSEGEDFSVPAVEKALEKFNQVAGTSISIFGKDGKLREDMSTVLDELGEKWDQVTNQQAKFGVATAIAGTRQMNSLMALLNGWDEYKSAVEVAQNSEGVGWEQNELFMESYEGKVKQLKSAQQGLYQNLFNADDMKPFIEGLTVIVKGATQLTKLFGGLPGILIALGPMLLTKLSVPLSQAVQNVKILRSTEASKVDKNEVKIDSLQNKGMITDEQAKKMKATNDEIRKNEELIESINKVKNARQKESEALDKAIQKQQKRISSKEYYKAGENGENKLDKRGTNSLIGANDKGGIMSQYNTQAKTIVEEESAKAQEKINNLKSTGQQKAQEVEKIEEATNEIIKKRLIDLAKESKFNEEHVQQAREERQATEGATGISSEVSNEELDNMSNNAGVKKTALQSDIDDTTKSLEKQYTAQMNVNTAISAGMNILFNMNQSYSSFGEAVMSGLIPALSLLAYTIIPAIINGATTLKAVINSAGGKVGLILTAISALTGVIRWFADSSKRAAEANKEFQDSFKQQNSTIAQNATILSGLSEKYKTLAKGVDDSGNNLSLTNEQYEEYKSIISQISEIMPNLAVKYNAQGEAIGFVTGKLQDLNEEYKKTRKKDYQELLYGEDNTEHNFSEVWKLQSGNDKHHEYYGDAVSEISNDQEFIAYLRNNASQDDIPEIVSQNLIFKLAQEAGIDNYKGTDEQKNQIKQAAIKIADEVEADINKDIQDLRNIVSAQFGYNFIDKLTNEQFSQGNQIINQMDFSGMSQKEAQNWIKDLGNNIQTDEFQEAFKKIFEGANEKTLKELNDIAGKEEFQDALGLNADQITSLLNVNEYNKNKEVYNNFIDELDNVSNKDNLKNLADQIPASEIGELRDAVESLKNSNIDLNNITLDQLREEIEKIKKYNEVLAQSFEDVSKKMDEVQSAYGTVKDAIRTYNETGAMSIDNLQAILSLKTEYLMLFINERGELDLSTEKIKEYVQALKSEMILTKLKEAIEEFINLSPQEREERVKNTTAILNEADAIQKLIKAKATEAAQKDWARRKTGLATPTFGKDGTVSLGFAEGYNSEEDYVNAYTEYFTNMYNGLSGLFNDTSFDLGSDSNDSDNKKDREDLEKKKKDLAKKRKEAEKQEKELGKKIRAAYKAEKEEVKRQKDLQEAIQGVADAQKDLVDKQKDYNDLLKKHEVDRYKESIEELTAAMEKLDDVASAIDSVMGLLGKDDYQKKYNLITQKIAQNDRIQAEANQEYQNLANSPIPDSSEAMQARVDAMQKAKDKSFQAAIDNEKQKKDLRNLEKEAQDRIDASNKELLDNTNSYFDNYIDNIRSAIDSIKGILDDFKRWQQGEISQDDYWTLTALNLENAALSLSSPIEKKDMTELDVTDIDTDSLLSQRKSDIDAIYEYAKEARVKAREEAEQDRQEEIEDMKEQIAEAEERIVEAQEKVQDCKEAIEEGYIATADAWDAVAEQRESMAETQNEIADLTKEIGTLEANLSGTMSSTKKVTEGANTATKAMNVTKQAAEEASKAIENAAKEISSDTSVGVLTEAIINAVKTAAANAKQSADYKLVIPDVLWGRGAITSFNMPTNVNSTADGLIGAMYGVIMYCLEKAKVLTKGSGNYHLYVPNINWGRSAEKNNYYNLIGVMYTTIIACFRQVNIYLGQLKDKQNTDYSLVAPALGKEWDKLGEAMKTKIKTAISELNDSMSDQKIVAPSPDEAAWTKFGKDIGVFVSKGIQQGVLNGEGKVVVNNVTPEKGGGRVGAADEPKAKTGTFAAAYEHYNPNVSRRTGAYGTNRGDHIHGGIDYAPKKPGAKIPVYASVSGIARAIPEAKSGGLGNCVKIQDSEGRYHLYGHLSSMAVSTGDEIRAGQKIGISGSTGNSTGVHVHYEVRGRGGSSKDRINPDSGEVSYGNNSQTKSSLQIKNKDQYGILQLIASMFGYSDEEITDGEYADLTNLSEMEKCIAFTKAVKAKFGNSGWGGRPLTDIEIAAIVGNAFQESTYNPKSGSAKGSGAYGAWQWLGGRKTKLLKTFPDTYDTLESQIAYLALEATNGGYEQKQFTKFLNEKQDLKAKTLSFRKNYEICGEWKANDPRRYRGAQDSIGYLQNANKYFTGTKDGTHPGGLAMVGDEAQGKYEYVQTPDGKITKMGEHGAEIVNLPKGTTVFSHSDSVALEKVYGRGLKGLPKYAKGTFVADYKDYTVTMYGENGGNEVKWLHSHGQVDEFATQLINEGWENKTNNSSTQTVVAETTDTYTGQGRDGKIYSASGTDDLASAVKENTAAVNNNTEAQNENTDVTSTVTKNETYNEKYVKMFNDMMTETAEPFKGYVTQLSGEITRINNLNISDEEKQKKLIDVLQGSKGILAVGSESLEKMRTDLFANAEYTKNEIDKDTTLTPTQKNEAKESINSKLTNFIDVISTWQQLTYDILFDNINSQNEVQIAFMEKMNIDSVKIRKAQSDNIAELEEQYNKNYMNFTKEQRQKAKETLQEAKKKLYEDERSAQKESFSLIEDELKDSGEFDKIAEYYYKDLESLKKAYQDGVISMEEYQQELKDTNDAFEQLNKEQRSRIKTQFDAAISAVNTEFSKLKETLDDQKTAIDNYYDLESKITELKAEKSKEYDAELRRNYDKQIEFLMAQKELYKNEGDPKVQAELMRTINESIKSFDLMIAKDILEKKRNQKVNRIFNQDTQTFDWVEDFDAIADAEKNLLDAEKDLKLLKLTNEQEQLNLRKQDLEDALNKPQQDKYYEAALQFFGSDFVKSLSNNDAFKKNILSVATVGAKKTYEVPDELKLNDNEKLLFGTNIFNQLDKDYTKDTRKLLKGVFYSKNTDYANEMLHATSKEDFLKFAKQRLAKSIDMGSNQGIYLQDLANRSEFTDLLNDKEFKKLVNIEESTFLTNSKENPERIAYYAPKLTLAGRDWLKDITSYALKNNLVGQSFANSMNYSTLNSVNDILDKVRSGDNIDSSISKEEIKNITVNVQGLNLNDNEKEVLADTLMKAIERQSITDKQ